MSKTQLFSKAFQLDAEVSLHFTVQLCDEDNNARQLHQPPDPRNNTCDYDNRARESSDKCGSKEVDSQSYTKDPQDEMEIVEPEDGYDHITMAYDPDAFDYGAYCDGNSAWNGDSAGDGYDTTLNWTSDSSGGHAAYTEDSANGSRVTSAVYDGDSPDDGYHTQGDTSDSGDKDVDPSPCINHPQNESETVDIVQQLQGDCPSFHMMCDTNNFGFGFEALAGLAKVVMEAKDMEMDTTDPFCDNYRGSSSTSAFIVSDVQDYQRRQECLEPGEEKNSICEQHLGSSTSVITSDAQDTEMGGVECSEMIEENKIAPGLSGEQHATSSSTSIYVSDVQDYQTRGDCDDYICLSDDDYNYDGGEPMEVEAQNTSSSENQIGESTQHLTNSVPTVSSTIPLRAPQIWRLSLSVEKFLFEPLPNTAKSTVAYGFHRKLNGYDVHGERGKPQIVKIESLLAEMHLHEAKYRLCTTGSIFKGMPKLTSSCCNTKSFAIYLGALSVGEEDWVGRLCLYLEVSDDGLVGAALGVVGERKSEQTRTKSAIYRRISQAEPAIQRDRKRLHKDPVVLNVGGVLFQFEAVDSSHPPDASQKPNESHDKHLFLAFAERQTPSYNSIFKILQNARYKSSSSSDDSSYRMSKKRKTNITIPESVVEKLDKNTTSNMGIPECSVIFKTKTRKPYDNNTANNIRESTCAVTDYEVYESEVQRDDLFPIDVENELRTAGDKDNLFNKAICIKTLSESIKNLKERLQHEYPGQVDKQQYIEGMVSSFSYSNVRWRLKKSIAVLKSLVEERSRSTFDIDQVSMDVNFKQSSIAAKAKTFASNMAFLNHHMTNLLEMVYSNEMPGGQTRLNYSLFCGLRGCGHTMLPAKIKSQFFSINDQAHEGDVFHVAVRFQPRKRVTTTQGQQGTWPVQFNEVEKQILEEYAACNDFKHRMFYALVMVAAFFNTPAGGGGTPQHFCKMRLLYLAGVKQAVCSDSYLECNRGSMLYLLGIIQVVALEERLAVLYPDKVIYDVTASLETYGGKSRYAVFLHSLDGIDSREERAQAIAKGLQSQLRKTSAINIIKAFSEYCWERLGVSDCNDHNVYIGVGATFTGTHKESNQPLYSSIPLSSLRKILTNDPTLDASPSLEDFAETNTKEDDVVDTADDEEFRLPEAGRTTIQFKDHGGNKIIVEPYPTYCGIPPPDLQPYTAMMQRDSITKLSKELMYFPMKWQSYLVDVREALGEAGLLKEHRKITELAAACLKSLSMTTEEDPKTGIG